MVFVVRLLYGKWMKATGRRRCQDLGIEYQRNRCFDGAVVKSNGPARRDIRHFVRDMYSGLLEDRSEDITRLHSGSNREIKKGCSVLLDCRM